jgi:cobalt-zinc-cadmium resistance protein CzcA
MHVIEWLIQWSVRNRLFVVIGTLVFAAVGSLAVFRATFDAFPDLTNVQVQILTTSPGLPSSEIEALVTVPIERVLGGVPGLTHLRSKSRTGISAITAVFEDGTDIWHARQLVKERLDEALGEIPDHAGQPQIAPPSTGLGEVYQFTLRSDQLTAYETYRIFERDIAPRLRAVKGVVDVNGWGGGSPQFHVLVDPFELTARSLTIMDLQEQLAEKCQLIPGGAKAVESEQVLIRGISNPNTIEKLEELPIRLPDGQVTHLGQLATVRTGGAQTVGIGSADGRGEAMFIMVQLLSGADALSTVKAIRQKVGEIRESLPNGLELEPIYDREKLVSASLTTVLKSLVEGGLLVIVVLFLLLGNLRAGLLVAAVIPLSMIGAFVGLNLLGYSGNLMSLGAIDFGLIVDGTIVVVESIVALSLGTKTSLREQIIHTSQKVAGPVFFAIGILLLVYTPILLLWGVEGKLFRPMALTVLLALFTSLGLTFTFIPAMASYVIRPTGSHHSFLELRLRRLYEPVLGFFLKQPLLSTLVGLGLILWMVVLVRHMGVEFVPRLEEGDMVVQTARLPSINPTQALREASRVETVLRSFPEVIRVASRTGAPAVATDPMGLEESDILVHLKPKKEWTTAKTLNGLFSAFEERLQSEAPGADLVFTQPIEMRFNELLQGITSDVGIKIFGDDLEVLLDQAQAIAKIIEEVPGAADVTPPVLEGVPALEMQPRDGQLLRYGVSHNEVAAVMTALERGLEVGEVIRGQFRDQVVLKIQSHSLWDVRFVPILTAGGATVPLEELVAMETISVPNLIQREAGVRKVAVLSNVRGRDLGGFVQEAKERLAPFELPPGYWIEWSGKYEQLATAITRMSMIIPTVLFLILGVLYVAFRHWRVSLLIFLNIPIAVSGGFTLLWLRGMPISLSAIVGFIALSGIAVMNGIVLMSRTLELQPQRSAWEAARESALARFRPVLMTASVAGIGFLPMALATGVGAEVQKPLATVVIGGLLTSTFLTLCLLPTFYRMVCRQEGPLAE